MGNHFDVFMSSTSRDLPEYRKALMDIITELGMFPIAMEHFQPTANNALQVCYDGLQEAEIFVGLYAFRYGFAPPSTMEFKTTDGTTQSGDGKTGITEWEYRWAIERKLPILLFVVDDDAEWKQSDIEKGTGAEALASFKKHITGVHVIKFFKTQAEFERDAGIALNYAKRELEKKVQISTPDPAELDKELDKKAEKPLRDQDIKNIERDIKKQKDLITVPEDITIQGNLPDPFNDRTFYAREQEQADMQRAIRQKKRLIGIYGRSGIGKTALVSKVLGDLEHDLGDVNGVAYFRGNTVLFTVENILESLAKYLPENHAFHTIRQDATVPIRERTIALLDALKGQYVVLIDNLETLQDDQSKAIKTPDLQIFLETVLDSNTRQVLTVVITSQFRIPFDASIALNETPIELLTGLEASDAIRLLRELDTSQRLPTDDNELHLWVNKVYGFPRALRALVGYLAGGRTRQMGDLLEDDVLFDQIVSSVVSKVLQELPTSFLKVIQGIAILGADAKFDLLRYLLAPHINVTYLKDILERLIDGYFVAHNPHNKTYNLHPQDEDYAIKSLHEGLKKGKLNDWTRQSLHKRMAMFYHLKRVPNPKNITDLAPQLHEFEHHIANQDYDTSCQILIQIDFDYLLLWGYVEKMLTLHVRLQGLVKNTTLAITSANSLGQAYRAMGQVEKSILHYGTSLEKAREQKHRQAEGAVLGNLGVAYSDLGQVEKAIAYYDQALEIAREIKDRLGEGNHLSNLGMAYHNMGQVEKSILHYETSLEKAREQKHRKGESAVLGNLGNAYRDLGQVEKAVAYYEDAFEIAREIKDRLGEGNHLGNLGVAYSDLGQVEKAIAYYEDAFEIAREIKDRRGEGIWIGNLGNAYSALGQVEKAITYYEQALVIDREIGDRRGEGTHLGNLGIAYLEKQDYSKAIELLNKAIEIADDIKSPQNQHSALWGLAKSLLYSGDAPQALSAILKARAYDAPRNNHAVATLWGGIALTLKDVPQAKEAFTEALRLADELLAKTAGLYEAIYERGVAHVGLALLGNASHEALAREDFARAKAIFAGEGILNDYRRMVEHLFSTTGTRFDTGL